MLRQSLTLLARAAGAQPAADDILTFQTINQAEWKAPGTWIDHSVLGGLTTGDDHTQYLLLAGRAGGQVANGGDAAGETLSLIGTSHATPGDVLIGENAQLLVEAGAAANTLVVDANSRVGIGTAAPTGVLHAVGTLGDVYVTTDGSAIVMTRDSICYLRASDASGSLRLQTAGTNTGLTITTAQLVGIGTVGPAASAKLEVASTTGALLVPRMTAAQRGALAGLDGMVVYQTDAPIGWYFHDNGGWVIGSALT